MTNETPEPPRLPRFNAGELIRSTVTGPHKGKLGFVLEVVLPPGDVVYRYRVQFSDGTTATLFGFELEADAA